MDKNQVASITTIEQLAAAYPALVASIREEGVKSVDVSVIKAEAVKIEKEKIIGLALIYLGDDAGQKFKAIVESGITIEAFKAVWKIVPDAKVTDDVETKKKEELLAAINAAGAVNPGSGKQPVNTGGNDFMSVVDEYIALHKCSKTDAMKKVIAENPELHEEYLKKVNVHLVK